MDTLYHVTYQGRLDSIKNEGLRGYSVTHIYCDYTIKHPDSVYAFLSFEDALKWWDNIDKDGDWITEENGLPVIIEFKDDSKKYNYDSHWEMRREYKSAVYKMPFQIVEPEQIVNIIEYDFIKDGIMKDVDDGEMYLKD